MVLLVSLTFVRMPGNSQPVLKDTYRVFLSYSTIISKDQSHWLASSIKAKRGEQQSRI